MKEQYKVYLRKITALVPAVILLALGISICLSTNLGVDLYTSFQKGIADHVDVDVGTMNTIFNICIIAAFLFINRKLINIGSIIVSVGVGPCMTLFSNLLNYYLADCQVPFVIQILMTCIGTIFISLALSWYISLEVGVQPMDMIIVTIAKGIKKTYGTGVYVFNILMLIGTLIVGENIGIGTVINFVCVGKLVDIIMPRIKPLVMKVYKLGRHTMDRKELIVKALEAREKAYAPYSNFYVGAALLTKEDEVFSGCNIENSGFTATNCAERTAIFKAVSEGKTKFKEIVIVGGLKGPIDHLCSPCGVCRQVMVEFCDPKEFKIILAKSPTDYKEYLLDELLPLGSYPGNRIGSEIFVNGTEI